MGTNASIKVILPMRRSAEALASSAH